MMHSQMQMAVSLYSNLTLLMTLAWTFALLYTHMYAEFDSKALIDVLMYT